jgi:hypothetical protein
MNASMWTMRIVAWVLGLGGALAAGPVGIFVLVAVLAGVFLVAWRVRGTAREAAEVLWDFPFYG